MGFVYADIELINGEDLALSRHHVIGAEEIKHMTVRALVDSGAIMLCINEEIQEYLKLPVVERRKAQLANGSIAEYDIVAPVELRFQNRRCSCQALVMPNKNEVLLGCIPMEDMDVLIHPTRNELIVHPDHPYFAQMTIK